MIAWGLIFILHQGICTDACSTAEVHQHLPAEADSHCQTFNENIIESKPGDPVRILLPDLAGFILVLYDQGAGTYAGYRTFERPVDHFPRQLFPVSDSPLRAPPFSV
ncbi:MAG: hypothetical protein EHM46_01280 [Bacteroidetes bacterium]|nr:MAG: hypothetical protein EHM46_01280 [Bacteroidota bacterium]